MDDLQLQRPLIPNVPADDLQFIELVSRAVAGELDAKTVHGLFVIRIDNWFDHKWLNFSGIGRVAFGQYIGTWFDRDTALDEFHQQGMKSTFPPFTPNRVITQDFYKKTRTARTWSTRMAPGFIHHREKEAARISTNGSSHVTIPASLFGSGQTRLSIVAEAS